MSTLSLALALDFAGVAVFAASGALSAGRQRLDLLGVLVISVVTSLGGGTLRDLLLDRHPLFWITDTRYLLVSTLAALLTLLWVRRFPVPERALLLADALGLALFTIMGARIAARAGLGVPISMMMGAITGAAGGVIRDVLSNDVPLILRRDLYATASLAGAGVYLGLREALADPAPAIWAGLATVVALRLLAIHRGWRLPVFYWNDYR
ncbi:MAG: trimeric intracellular cation channel family protein [Candidatus Cloacimonetes bacterium]|nr:trimeric intracellular cation channel family protein [Candidatus Cloacimonadota bacterium]